MRNRAENGNKVIFLILGLWLGTMEVTEQMRLQTAYQIDKDENGTYTTKLNVIEHLFQTSDTGSPC
ncbi:MAG: hypothetical protein E4H10_02075 [Bacteroidia bacterium]|nr:MAG: hypothetical protein E4H10_02075 [Bacteroidia bacterium]